MNKLTNEQTAYIAGIVDGEGTIGIGLSTNNSRVTNKIIYSYTIFFQISNNNIVLLNWIMNITGFGVIISSRHATEKRKENFTLSFRRDEILQLLPKILSYLIIKKEQAELIIKFNSLRKGGRWYPLTEEEMRIKWLMYQESKILNEKG